MPSTHKKVVVRKLDRDTMNGYLGSHFVVEGKLELLNAAGNAVAMDLKDIKLVYFVRDWADSDTFTRKTFATRPRTEGLWVRLNFRDNESLEAMMPNDLTQVSGDGVLVIPPDTRGNLQRIFVPRSSLNSVTVLAVIGGPAARRRRPAVPEEQVPMFSE